MGPLPAERTGHPSASNRRLRRRFARLDPAGPDRSSSASGPSQGGVDERRSRNVERTWREVGEPYTSGKDRGTSSSGHRGIGVASAHTRGPAVAGADAAIGGDGTGSAERL